MKQKPFENISDPGLRAALIAYSPNVERGALSAFAKSLNRSVAAVSQWKKVPIELVATVSKLTGVPDYVIRPDIFRRQSSGRA